MRQQKARPVGLEKGPRQIFPIGESQAVHHRMQRPVQSQKRLRKRLQVLILGHVARQDRGHLQMLGKILNRVLLALAQIGQPERGALPRECLRDRISQTPLVRNTQNEGEIALQKFGHGYLQCIELGANRGSGAKNHRGEWAPNPGTDMTGSEFPAKCAGNSCQSCQSLRSVTGLPPCSLLRCAASRNAKISSVSSFDTGGWPVWKNFTISTTRGR